MTTKSSPGEVRASRPIAQPAGPMRYWPLLVNLTRREARQRYKGSALGLLWTLITPAIMIAAYTVVFQFIFRSPVPNFALFIFIGLSAWVLFFGSATVAVTSLVGQPGLVTKVRFPRALITMATMGGNALTGIAMVLVATVVTLIVPRDARAASIGQGGDRETLLMLPPLLILLAMLAVGFGLMLAALQVYFRDIEHIIAAIGLPWIFLSPVFWSFYLAPAGLLDKPWLENVLHWANPPAPIIIAIQDVMFWGKWPNPWDVGYAFVVGAIVLAIGVWVFRKLEPEMAAEL